MTKTIEDLFYYLVFLSDFLIIVQVLFFSQKVKNKRILWLIAAYCCLNSLSNYTTTTATSTISYYSLAFFTIAEYLVFAYFYFTVIKSSLFRKLILIFSIIFSIVVIINYLQRYGQAIDSVPIGIETILILLYSFYYLYEQMNDLSDSFIYNRYHFWLAIGIMVYLGGSFFIYIFADTIDRTILNDYWFLTYAFYIIKNIFFLIGFASYNNTKPNKNQLRPSLN
ncbi:MAG TPA: hypothetical protein VHK91_16050 [Flavisolibacter sp.]|jgi:hypothetical protein|nr:hypothetical protein [Flavisolibacter sp.]